MARLIVFISRFPLLALLTILLTVDWLQREAGSKPAPLPKLKRRSKYQRQAVFALSHEHAPIS